MEGNSEIQRKLFSSLLIDEETIKRDIENKAQKVFMLERSGRVIFKVPEKELNNKQVIGIHILGRYIAHELGIFENSTVSADDLAGSTGLDVKTIRARISDLKKQSIVESPERGVYVISLVGGDRLLDEILELKGEN